MSEIPYRDEDNPEGNDREHQKRESQREIVDRVIQKANSIREWHLVDPIPLRGGVQRTGQTEPQPGWEVLAHGTRGGKTLCIVGQFDERKGGYARAKILNREQVLAAAEPPRLDEMRTVESDESIDHVQFASRESGQQLLAGELYQAYKDPRKLLEMLEGVEPALSYKEAMKKYVEPVAETAFFHGLEKLTPRQLIDLYDNPHALAELLHSKIRGQAMDVDNPWLDKRSDQELTQLSEEERNKRIREGNRAMKQISDILRKWRNAKAN